MTKILPTPVHLSLMCRLRGLTPEISCKGRASLAGADFVSSPPCWVAPCGTSQTVSLALQKPTDLRQVIQVVSGFHDDELSHRLTTTLVMDAVRRRVHRLRHASQER